VDSNNYSNSFGFQWNYFHDTQVDKFNNTDISKERVFNTTKWSDKMSSEEKILEVGSGSGRFTEILVQTNAKIFSLDYSTAVEANANNNSNHNNLFLSQASVYEMPFNYNFFDKIFCLGVIQHTPDVEKSFAEMVKHLKPSGEIVIDVYADTLKTKFYSKYWFRPITKRINKKKLLYFIKWYIPYWYPVSTILLKIPILGKFLSQIIPICNYSKIYPTLNKSQLVEWAILDTFDMLSPEYDIPQSKRNLEKWIIKYNLELIELRRGYNGYILKAKKK
jgi:ubiquinone/menaquinone biosynthesis C-methylase UbiE